MSKKTITPAAALVGAALAGGLSAADLANAADNPFGATPLERGYMLLAEEGKCGGDKSEEEGNCGEQEGKCGEGQCGNQES
jgi:uncharacterized low-complexity protein